ncbi:hypothetical protein Q5530_19345 [Saccharothrix sp. BKS2]|uniref:hypothetical protein n=1 Tax=Saccharothrix sp. BKS2 TaxID=3064400 RepID=UPI0039E77C5C
MGRILERRPAALLAKVAAFVLAASAVVVLGPVAQAGTDGPRSVVTKSAVRLSAPDVSAQAVNTITRGAWSCTLTVSNPLRWYGGSGGGVQGAGWLNCSHVMPQLEIFVGVIRNNAVVNLVTDYDTSTIQVNTVSSVSPYIRASYLTAAIGYVEWPDGVITEFPELQTPAFTI